MFYCYSEIVCKLRHILSFVNEPYRFALRYKLKSRITFTGSAEGYF